MRRRNSVLSTLEELQVFLLTAYILILSFVALAGLAIALYRLIFE